MSQEQPLLDLLACPRCKGKLESVDSPQGYACTACGLLYAVEDGLPNMLVEEARPWPPNDAGAAP